jgi:hypothetical protein
MGYGRRFLASLPPAPITHALEDIERFFAADRLHLPPSPAETHEDAAD